MITLENFPGVLEALGFIKTGDVYTKHFENSGCDLKADFKNRKLIYPTEKGLEVNDGTTSNFEHNENFVVFECAARLLQKGYRPEHIELEPRWSLGHGGKSGKADICVKNKDGSEYLCIIECKTADEEYKKEMQNMKADGGQLFSYWQQVRRTKWLVLYASDWEEKIVGSSPTMTYTIATVNCSDDANFVELAKDDKTLKLYKDAATAKDLFEVWKETYEQKFLGDIIFDDETVPYDIGVLPLKKKRLVDFSRDDKIVNQFEEILRHNNVSDKENAFNRLIALFIAKLYDEKTKTDESEVDFQYKTGTDTYQKMQDRLQKLHHFGMKDFMKEDVFYVADDYVEKVISRSLHENRAELEAELNETITKLKFYTNNDFSFKDVHNKTLFYQNGKILVEMVELFQKYRIIDSKQPQLLGDMFEQLLNKGFKQNEGQFFTPVPICAFIWKCLPLESVVIDEEKHEAHYPKIIDYACGAGHFLTEGFREINETVRKMNLPEQKGWERDAVFGIEKDYRLARVSKISLFMHGADNGNIVFGDGLDNHDNEGIVIENGKFDILVANPPYSVSAFKNHLELKHNNLKLLDYISKDGKEIETLFVERIGQLLRPNGIAAVILPSSILTNGSLSYIKAREEILKNFGIRAIVQFGSKTFGATGTNTVVLYLKKYNEPPVKSKTVRDIVSAVFENKKVNLESDKEIFASYCAQIQVPQNEYLDFLKDADENADFEKYKRQAYFGLYTKEFEQSADSKKFAGEKLFKAFYSFVLETEKDKLYYFALAAGQKTLVVSAPQENSEQEKFLGYTWSNRKGDEGIKIKSENPNETCGLLYNTRDEEQSIARYVKDAFLGIYRTGEYITVNNLCDMIDFSRSTFDKAIKANAGTREQETGIRSKFPAKSVENLLVQIEGNKTKIEQNEIKESGKFPVITQETEKLISGYTDENAAITDLPLIVFGDHSCTFKYVDFPFVRGADGTQLLKTNQNEVITKYFYYYLCSVQIENSARYERHFKYLKTTKIPLPPLEVQKKIVAECEKVDSQFQNAQKEIDGCKKQIEEVMDLGAINEDLGISDKIESVKLGEIASYSTERISYSEISPETYISTDNLLQNCEGAKIYDGKPNVESVVKYQKGDILVSNIRPYLKKIWLSDKDGGCSPDVLVFRIADKSKVLPEFLYHAMAQDSFFDFMMSGKKGIKMPRGDKNSIPNYKLKLPPLSEQQKIVAKISALEEKIAAAKNVIASCPQQKQAILKTALEK